MEDVQRQQISASNHLLLCKVALNELHLNLQQEVDQKKHPDRTTVETAHAMFLVRKRPLATYVTYITLLYILQYLFQHKTLNLTKHLTSLSVSLCSGLKTCRLLHYQLLAEQSQETFCSIGYFPDYTYFYFYFHRRTFRINLLEMHFPSGFGSAALCCHATVTTNGEKTKAYKMSGLGPPSHPDSTPLNCRPDHNDMNTVPQSVFMSGDLQRSQTV